MARTKGSPARIGTWCRRLPSEGVDSLALLHDGVGTETQVAEWQPSLADDPESLASEALDAGQADCDARGVRSAYRLVSRNEDGRTLSAYPMRLSPTDPVGAVEDGVDVAGQIRQQMRHNEALARLVVMTNTAHLRMVSDLMRDYQQRLTELSADSRALRELEAETAELRAEGSRTEQLAAKLAEVAGPAIPGLVDRLLPAAPAGSKKGVGSGGEK